MQNNGVIHNMYELRRKMSNKRILIGKIPHPTNVPEKSGAILGKIMFGPKLANWPRASSMKKSGRPAHSSIIT